MSELLSAARLLGQLAISVVVMAGHGPHRTAIANARVALAEAQHRARERREADAALARVAHGALTPLRMTRPRMRTWVR
ncbi:MAG: hypothetical protein ACRDT8_13240 [Micromonosporaceae bacterium]